VSSPYAAPVQALIDELGRLPGIGPKSAQRIAFYLLQVAPEDARRLSRSITEAKERITWCRRCFNISEGEVCTFCLDDRRDPTLLCVVQDPRDIVALERTHEFKGRYHVLQGAISPIQGIGPEQLRIKELLHRVADEGITEVILATNPDIEGDATAMFVARALKELDVRVTRIASGLPVGGDLEYADEVTLGRALEGRRPVDQ
jgi:recombination protein RecR